MIRLLVLLLSAAVLHGADRWVEFRSGPFEVFSNAGERAGRARLNELEQLRYGLEQLLGRAETQPIWPVRVLVVNSADEATSGLGWSRDAFVGAAPVKGPIPRTLQRACALLLVESGEGRLPTDVESALADLFSTLQVDGSLVMLGAPPPAAERTHEWAKMHLLAVTEPYYGKLRTVVHNLERGVEADPAYRNALGHSSVEMDKEAEAYLRAGVFGTTQLKRKPINPDRDFEAKPVEAARGQLLRPDLLLSLPARGREAGPLYQAILKSSPAMPEALEGLALVTLADRMDEARELFGRVVAGSSASARAYVQYARLQSDRDKAVAALEKAAKLNQRWGMPYFELARREPDPALRAQLYAAAARREPRSLEYWYAVAQAQEAAGQFVEAAKAWASAEVAAGTPDDRKGVREVRQYAEEHRREQEARNRERKVEEAKREIEALKQRSMASIQASIDQANREHPPEPPSSGKLERWWDGPRTDGKIQGTLRQVDCLGKQARLSVAGADGKVTRLLIRDASQISFAGGGEKTLGCGVQKPVRRVVIEYYVKPDAKLGTAGDVAVIEFP